MGHCFLYGNQAGKAAAPSTPSTPVVSDPVSGLRLLYGGTRPETADPGTIWVPSAKATGAYILAADQPEAEEGLVWLKTSSTGPSVTMKRPIYQVFHVVNALIYLDGTWTIMPEAALFNSGAWSVLFNSSLVLLKSWDKCTSVTGGYTSQLPFLDATSGLLADMQSEYPNMYSSSVGTVFMRTVNSFTLAGYNKLLVTWEVTRVNDAYPNDTMALVVLDSTKTKAVAELPFGGLAAKRTDVLDISGLDKGQAYYIAVYSLKNVDNPALKGKVYSLELQS